MKPQDFFLGIVEFFAILLPGATLVGLFLGPSRQVLLAAGLFPYDATGWVAFALAAYLAGHLLHAVSSYLDPAYDALYARPRRARAGGDPLFERARALRDRALGAHRDIATVFSWAGSYVRVASPSAMSEIEMRAAESKFFRSLSVVLFIAFVLFAQRGATWTAIGLLVLVAFCLGRYCSRRWDSTRLTYEYYVLLHTMSGEATAAPSTSAAPAALPASPVGLRPVRPPIRRLGQR